MFRNREIRQAAALWLILTVIGTAAGFWIAPAAGALVFGFAVLLGVVFYGFTKARYERIARISEEIDQVLHQEDRLYIGGTEEGELSILQSEIVKMTMRIREQNEALKQEKTHLADSLADIAHQLRTPLTSVTIILSLLEKNADGAEQKTLIREAEGSFRQMDFLLTSLLKLSRLDAGIVALKREKIRVEELIVASLGPFLIPMELHNIQVQTHIPERAQLLGDFSWLSEAFQNMIKNSVESVGDEGRIEISCEENPLFTEIVIHDSGAGFRKEDLPHLFERFYRGKDSGAAGYGIGLALSKTIIVRQGGTVTAGNHPQGGAVFSIRFPSPGLGADPLEK